MDLEIEALRVAFHAPDGDENVILNIKEWSLGRGEEVCLVGESGSGKTTLLHCLAGVVKPDQGEIRYRDQNGDTTVLNRLSENARDAFRARHVGYVFQTFNLLQFLTAEENIAIAAHFGGHGRKSASERSRKLLESVGLLHRAGSFPGTMSVGEQQRLAIARAVVNSPDVILADEPTANLDTRHGDEVLDILRATAAEHGAALILVTHEPRVFDRFPKVVHLSEISG